MPARPRPPTKGVRARDNRRRHFPPPEVPPLMNVQDRSNTFDLNKYGVGQPVRRTEDPVLVQGQGKYTDDLSLPGQAYAMFVRSQVGHGTIKGIDTAAAKAMPGVLGVYTAADLTAYGTMKCV